MFPIVKQAFEDQGLILLETEYVNAKTPMRYICPMHPGDVQYKSYDGVGRSGCLQCSNAEQGERQKSPQDLVAKDCLERGFRLLEGQTYERAKQILKFQCLAHPDVDYRTSANTILTGHGGCRKCKSEKLSEKQKHNFATGRQKTRRREENYSWKGGTTGLNDYLRQRGQSWIKKWLLFFNYTCVVTGEVGGKLHVHHAEPFHQLRDQVLKNLGLTLKERISDYSREELDRLDLEYDRLLEKIEGYPIRKDYHKQFHAKFGHSTTKEQFLEFVRFHKGAVSTQALK
ncbi:hypothetical protein [Brevibacillus centrosporus]|uniref:hypothetical protein n=1 Tax=Brevibacillus centrosporus TaxID=54910 RepID=UPI003B01318B